MGHERRSKANKGRLFQYWYNRSSEHWKNHWILRKIEKCVRVWSYAIWLYNYLFKLLLTYVYGALFLVFGNFFLHKIGADSTDLTAMKSPLGKRHQWLNVFEIKRYTFCYLINRCYRTIIGNTLHKERVIMAVTTVCLI